MTKPLAKKKIVAKPVVKKPVTKPVEKKIAPKPVAVPRAGNEHEHF